LAAAETVETHRSRNNLGLGELRSNVGLFDVRFHRGPRLT
jgi:hypothetical protein